jgi:hypothetical protein
MRRGARRWIGLLVVCAFIPGCLLNSVRSISRAPRTKTRQGSRNCGDRDVVMHLNTAIRPFTLLLLSLLTSALSAEAVVAGAVVGTPPKCLLALEGWVNDAADVLSLKERRELSEILSACHYETHHQLVVLTIPSLSGEPLETYSLRVLNCWGLGYKGIDSGILVLLALSERFAVSA